jgi:hypothetical protein
VAVAAASREAFRVVHFSVQTDHVHLIVETAAGNGLRAGINGLACRMARAETQPCPVAPARTWLAMIGWRRAGGLIGTDEAPGAK